MTLRTLAAVLMTIIISTPGVRADPDATLRVETRVDGLAFDLTGTGGTGPWLLQHSRNGRDWEDVQFWEAGEKGAEPPEIAIPWGILSDPDAPEGFFRAIQLENDDPFRRRFLAERAKWRLSGNDSYQYELSQNFGRISWRGIVNVADGEITSFTTLDPRPPSGNPPPVPTINGLFERIANAIAANAVTINVTWDQDTGAPLTGYIDLDELLADEESGWSINAFPPAP